MKFEIPSLSLESVASIGLAAGLVLAYFFGSNLSSSSGAKSQEVAAKQQQTTEQTTSNKKKKKKQTTATPRPVVREEEHRLPGGNESFSPSFGSVTEHTDDPSLLIASIEAGNAAQEQRVKAKKAKKKTKNVASGQPRNTTTRSQDASNAPKVGTTQKGGSLFESQSISVSPEEEGEWRVVNRNRGANTTADSLTTTSATDPGSPLVNTSPLQAPDTKERPNLSSTINDSSVDEQASEDSEDDGMPNSLVSSRFASLFGKTGEDSAEDGFIPLKSKGRKDSQRTGAMSTSTRVPESMTKRQRQNKAKRDAEKSAKAQGEKERLEKLARHRREQERARIEEAYKKGGKLSGGMSMSVGNGGKAEWD